MIETLPLAQTRIPRSIFGTTHTLTMSHMHKNGLPTRRPAPFWWIFGQATVILPLEVMIYLTLDALSALPPPLRCNATRRRKELETYVMAVLQVACFSQSDELWQFLTDQRVRRALPGTSFSCPLPSRWHSNAPSLILLMNIPVAHASQSTHSAPMPKKPCLASILWARAWQ